MIENEFELLNMVRSAYPNKPHYFTRVDDHEVFDNIPSPFY